MALTEFGKTVRKARIDTGQTLLSMAQELGVTASFLSAMETGRKKISAEWVTRITGFFDLHGAPIPNLDTLAAASNEVVPVDGLPLQHQLLVAGFAKSPYSAEELKEIAAFLERVNSRKNDKVKHAVPVEGE
ncbi:helix-turn-helix domain-containing protein [Ralstonia sp. UBA689]|uniref:helix-turn-helix domain-containing protein n=1 Tax=Ralstonia sp. UBA689 TaxID=1947373 RepID=UPI0025EB71D7|nr:helix-turn-helix transcriptional regulator [Ralstonia sp. UBA689]